MFAPKRAKEPAKPAPKKQSKKKREPRVAAELDQVQDSQPVESQATQVVAVRARAGV